MASWLAFVLAAASIEAADQTKLELRADNVVKFMS
jgi:hypothetical protein